MYVPDLFEEQRTNVLHEFICANSLGILVAHCAGEFDANHIPFELDARSSPLGRLRAHIARGNPLWRNLAQGANVLAIFQGPHAYISPSWQPSRRKHGKVQPSWYYAAVHAYGTVALMHDKDWLMRHLTELTDRHEAAGEEPWSPAEAPKDFIARLLDQIVGLEIQITRLLGKWQVSQQRNSEDRRGIIDALAKNTTAANAGLVSMVRALETPGSK